MAEPLPCIGRAHTFGRTAANRYWRKRLTQLEVGAVVDVLLDCGDVVRTTLRYRVTPGHLVRCQVWVEGIVGSYATGRVRPAGGWRRAIAWHAEVARAA